MTSNHWANKRVLVTGATGLVGSWLTKELLTQGAYVVALILDADPQSEFCRSGDSQSVAIVNGPLEEFGTLERAITSHETDTVVHLGAQTIVSAAQRNPLQTFEANIRGTYNLLEACRRHSSLVKSVVVASSDKAYGPQTLLPYTEETPLQGVHPYEVSKSCADLIAQSYHRSYNLPVSILRCGNIYGGGDLNWSRLVPGTIRSLLRDTPPLIRSDGSFLRDYVYVQDVVRAYLCVAEALHAGRIAGEAFNFSPEAPVSVLAMVDRIRRLMGREDLEPKVLNVAKGEIRDQYLSSAKAREQLGWQCQFDLERGLRQTIAWYEKMPALRVSSAALDAE